LQGLTDGRATPLQIDIDLTARSYHKRRYSRRRIRDGLRRVIVEIAAESPLLPDPGRRCYQSQIAVIARS